MTASAHGSPSPSSRRLSIISRRADVELSHIHATVENGLLVDGRGDLEELLGQLLAREPLPAPRTLDLIGHSTPGTSLLQLGDWVIDAASTQVTSFFREVAEQDVLPRLGVHAVRLLGSNTAGTEHGRHTIYTLAKILDVEVYGGLGPVYAGQFDADGFRDDARFVLRNSADLRGDPSSPPAPSATRSPRTLDIDSLPRIHLAGSPPWPRHLASLDFARDVLATIRREHGMLMPGLLATPSCELALPASEPGTHHLAQILLDYELVRTYPDGPGQPAIVYPVRDRFALHALIASLPRG